MRRSRLAALLVAPLAFAAPVLVPDAAHAVVSNKLVNPGFEAGVLDPWQTWSLSDADADLVESSTKFGQWKGVHRKSSAYEVYTYQVLSGLPAGTYVVSGAFRSSGGQSATNFTVKSGSTTLVNTAVPAAATKDWARLQLTEVTISTGQQLEVGVYSDSPADKWLYFDDIRVDLIAPNPAETTEGTNLVTNAGFESSTGWASSGSAQRVTDNARTDSASMRLGPTNGFTYQDVTSGFVAGQTVVLTGWGKAGTQGGVALLGVQALSSSGSLLWDAKTPFFATSYGKNSTTAVVPANTAKLRVYVYKEDGDRSSLVYVDDVRLYVSSGTTYYVDPAGDNTRSGTSPSQAWATLARANDRVWAPGDTLLLKGGSTFTGGLDFGSASSGTMNHPITVSSYGSGRAVINAPAQNGILLQDASGFHVYNLDLTGPGVTQGVYEGIFATNQTSSTQRGLLAVDNVTVSGFYLGINANSRFGKGFGPITIMNSTTRDNFREGTNVFGYDERGEDDPDEDSWHTPGIFSRAYIGYVTSYNNQQWSGILIGNTDDAMIEHSTAYDIGETAVGNQGPVGIWTIGTRRGTVQFNSSSDVGSSNKSPGRNGDKLDGDGYDVSWGNTDALYQYNLAYANEGPGFLVDDNELPNAASNKVTLRYNVSHGNCQDNNFCGEIYVYGDNPVIDIHNNSTRVTKAGQAAIRFTGEWDGKGTVTGSRDTRVRNNIFSLVAGAEAVHVTAVKEDDNPPDDPRLWADPGDITFQGNLYWADGNGSLAIKDEGVPYSSLTAWRAAGREKNGTTNTGVQADPLYAAPGTIGPADSLKIGSSSPARDAGLNLSSLFGTSVGAVDHFGSTLPQGTAYDIGAHEWRP